MAVVLVAALLAACGNTATPADVTDEAEAAETTAPEATEETATEEAEAEAPAASGDGTPISEIDEVPVLTTSNDVAGVGYYSAAEPYAIPAGDDPETEPVQAIIMPYAIYPNMEVESLEEFDASAYDYHVDVEGFTFEWSLETPEGSNAELLTDGGVARWELDVPGDFVLTLTATDADGNSGTDSWTVHAADDYLGVGTMTGGEAAIPECAACHGSKADAWAATQHATIFSGGIDGLESDHYGPNCISCHTTGFNNRPEAVNGGFDDVAAEAGWEFPAELQEGNWEQMVEDYPEVAALANVQCESCHGPGADHVTGDVQAMGPIGTSLEYGTCAQCHAEDPYHFVPQQWENSAHADRTAQAFWYPTGQSRAACAACHTGGGYIDAANGVPMAEQSTDYQPITCAVCHDPHGNGSPDQLRVFDTVTLPDGTEVAEAGAAATCMSCHNTRVDPAEAVEGEFQTPHYSSAAELLNGVGGYTWGVELPQNLHTLVIEDSCITCHMADSPGTTEDGEPLPGHNEVGGHTFAMVNEDGVENVAICQQCHGDSMTTFEMVAQDDYDGDGAVETNTEEIQGLLDVLEPELVAQGVEILDHHPYFNLPEDADTNLKGALYNFKLVSDSGTPAHNLEYIVSLLQLSYERLTGDQVPGADILY